MFGDELYTTIIPHLHRRPPKPLWFYTTPLGTCKWCQEPILEGQRLRPSGCGWHLECLNEYKILFDWRFTRDLIWERERGVCKSCGTLLYDELADDELAALNWLRHIDPVGVVRQHAFEVDHVVPLHQWSARSLTDLNQDNFIEWFEPWMPSNLQLLCPDCHKAKTAEDRRA